MQSHLVNTKEQRFLSYFISNFVPDISGELEIIDVIIVSMRSLLGKYFVPCLIGIILEFIVLFVVIIENFRITSKLADSIYTFITGSTVTKNIFDFISGWAILISVLPILVILFLLLSSVRNNRRNQALSRIHNWAQNAILLLADYRQSDIALQRSPALRYEGIRVLVETLKKHSVTIHKDARVVGGRLRNEIQKAIRTFQTLDEKASNHDDSAYDDLRALQRDLSEVMMLTFEMYRAW